MKDTPQDTTTPPLWAVVIAPLSESQNILYTARHTDPAEAENMAWKEYVKYEEALGVDISGDREMNYAVDAYLLLPDESVPVYIAHL